MSSRREPLLWLQFLAIGAIPLELLLLRLVLAGSDLGSLPGLERILAWAIGALAPAVLFWKRPPDWGSLLLVRLPLQGRDQSQQQLSRDLQTLPVKLIAAAGVVPLLTVLWWIDTSALLVADLSPFSNGSRLGSLLLATPLLALLLWQWHQLVQCVWLLIKRDDETAADSAASEGDWREACLSIGLGLIQLPPLDWATKTPSPGGPPGAVTTPSSDPALQKTRSQASDIGTQAPPVVANESEPEPSPSDRAVADSPSASDQEESETTADQTASPLSGTVKPQQSSEEDDSASLNQEIGANDSLSRTEPKAHHEESETSGSEQSEPDQPPQPPPGSA